MADYYAEAAAAATRAIDRAAAQKRAQQVKTYDQELMAQQRFQTYQEGRCLMADAEAAAAATCGIDRAAAQKQRPLLPLDASLRKGMPIARGVLDYFPRAIAEVAHVSLASTEQHHPGEPMHWEKEKSADEADCIARHLIERGGFDSDGLRHSAKLAWRALALLQRELDESGV